jgi:hypothetical protein
MTEQPQKLEPLRIDRANVAKALSLAIEIVAADVPAAVAAYGPPAGPGQSLADAMKFARLLVREIVEAGGGPLLVPPVVNQALSQMLSAWPAVRAAYAAGLLKSLGVQQQFQERQANDNQ